MLFLWFFHACRRGAPRFLMVSDHINYLTFEDPGAVNTVRRALKLAQAGDLHGAAEIAGVEVTHAAVVSEGLRRGMRFSIGAEMDNDPRSRPDAQNIVDAMRPDGLIRSVHFLTIDHPEKGADFQWPFDNPEFVALFDHVGTAKTWELYMARLLEDIEKLPGHIVGHFYVPAIFGHWPERKKLEEYEDQLLDACATRGMAVEINTRFLYRDHSEEEKKKYLDANLRLMRKAKKKGVGIAIGSDAHSPKDQAGAFETALKMLDDVDINEIVFPVNGRLARVALRATREHIERHAAPRQTVTPGSSITGFGRAELGLPEPTEEKAIASKRTQRDTSAKKRTTGPERTTKAPAKSGTAAKPAAKKAVVPVSKPAPKPVAPPKKTAGKKPVVAKTAAKKVAPAKAPVAKTVMKKKPAVKKPVAKKPAVKKVAASKGSAKKASMPVKKHSVVKHSAKKGAAKKATVKKTVAKKPGKKRR